MRPNSTIIAAEVGGQRGVESTPSRGTSNGCRDVYDEKVPGIADAWQLQRVAHRSVRRQPPT
eukprot:CAMPEP_0176136100 /NCGR_PEP_ID=MMETSP0120_2-20121206/69061_1 /TAXON_ID=160619 /ORGANISM="Kryptoperidinium foliaceum, Strain CCMP 1326" /LENGTH=61 /DNA_ID=CAMNT_0017471855 /DNA_START=55 /DNA_END=236 /DNA_ORIENTATION=+